jgi:hypothetical protein
MTWTEEQKAELSKKRGHAASQIKDPEERKKFISRQGKAEEKTKGKVPEIVYEGMKRQADVTAASPSYKKGVKCVPRTGLAKLHRGEAVLSKEKASKMRKQVRK